MTAIAWALLGALCAVGAEMIFVMNRTTQWLSPANYVGIAGGIAVNYCVWQMLRTESILGAFVLFAFATATFRMFASFAFLASIPASDILAYTFLMIALIVKRMAV